MAKSQEKATEMQQQEADKTNNASKKANSSVGLFAKVKRIKKGENLEGAAEFALNVLLNPGKSCSR